jgi:tRNA (cmo5U34)-methyltransferase
VSRKGFDRIAFAYDFLAKLVFGDSISTAQKHFLDKILNGSKILILGGGSGWLLLDLFQLRPNSEVWYIDASEKMMMRAKKKCGPNERVHFIHGTEDDVPDEVSFDVVITNFYLDLFANQSLEVLVNKVGSSMAGEGIWIVTDFVDGDRWWQKLMLQIMYWFFRGVADIEPEKLPEWEAAVERYVSKKVGDKFFCQGFIKTACYQF